METFTAGLFLAGANKAVIDCLAAPFRKKFPDLDLWWLVYVALVTGAILAWFARVNLFTTYIPDLLVGRIATCLFVGGGSSLIHDVFKKDEFELFSDEV